MTTASQRGAANRRRGLTAERDLCRWLRSNGFPQAERAVRTGFRTADRTSADPGDLTGTGLIVWSVKDCAVEQHAKWRDELDVMLQAVPCHPDQLGLIVHKRRGHATPGAWWVWIQLQDLAHVIGLEHSYHGPQWFRTTLDELIPLVRAAGYGDPEEAA